MYIFWYKSTYTSWHCFEMVMIPYSSRLLEKCNNSYYGERQGDTSTYNDNSSQLKVPIYIRFTFILDLYKNQLNMAQ